MPQSLQLIRDRFATLRRTQKARHRDIADQLGLSEGELIAAHAGLDLDDTSSTLRVMRLQAHWPALVTSLETLGTVMALTRNASCVHETTGVYCNTTENGQAGTVHGEGIHLQFFYRVWKHGFSVVEQTEQGTQRSLQFFDATGNAIHKVFMKPNSHVDAYEKLTAKFAAPDQAPGLMVQVHAKKHGQVTDADVDTKAFHRAWDGLRRANDFGALLQSFGLSHAQALRLADPLYTQKIEPEDCQTVLQSAATQAVPITVQVGNAGALQQYCGPINRVAVMGPWVNVLDPTFNLHLREDLVASAWVVKKPTVDGLVTSLELFDQHDEWIATICGAQKNGMPETCEWRDLIQQTQQEPKTCPV